LFLKFIELNEKKQSLMQKILHQTDRQAGGFEIISVTRLKLQHVTGATLPCGGILS
jgi:hypothetical protein